MASFRKLTRPIINKLGARQKITENGITFERLANGDGIYSVNIMVDRVRIHRVIGRESDGTTRANARSLSRKRKPQREKIGSRYRRVARSH